MLRAALPVLAAALLLLLLLRPVAPGAGAAPRHDRGAGSGDGTGRPQSHQQSPPCSSGALLPFLEAASNTSLRALQTGEPGAVPTHKIWRLNVPGSASSNLFKRVREGIAQPWRVRLHGRLNAGSGGGAVAGAAAAAAASGSNSSNNGNKTDGSHTSPPPQPPPPPSCGFELKLRGCPAAQFRAAASFAAPARQVQHADYKHLAHEFAPRWLRDTLAHAEPEPGQRLVTMTMVRDPFHHFMRTYEKKSVPHGGDAPTFMFVPTWRARDATAALPDAAVPASEFAARAFWKWNVFARALAGNYSGGRILSRHIANDDITEAAARALNTEVRRPPGSDAQSGSDCDTESPPPPTPAPPPRSELLEVAKRRLLGMSFFGVFERIDETMELLAHSMCWDATALGFKRRAHRTEYPALATRPDGEPEDATVVRALIEENNAVDRALYEFAAEVFDTRVRAMRADQERGIMCRYLDTGCYVERVEGEVAAAVAAAAGGGDGGAPPARGTNSEREL